MSNRSFTAGDDREVVAGTKKRTKTPSEKENGAYTVGWICALSTEYVTAQVFLDKKHGRPEHVSKNDANDYTLGEIGGHNVIIVVLPDGEYGTASAARVAKDMIHSFPNIRIGLMVGIGGGAPSQKHDIRLGDIVVSAPRDGKGGVFQYDFGKTIQDQRFETTGFLNQPPAVLRAAVSGLITEHEIEGHGIQDAIENILGKYPRLRRKFQRPDPSSDRLYQSNVVHSTTAPSIGREALLTDAPPTDNEVVLTDDGAYSTGPRSCAETCGNSPPNLKIRQPRTEEEAITIHYGLIASANQLMKDALVRDKLAAEKDVLCFEMEAAGLMNHFPCLVVRGICDYSDSHKNKEWQGYAAMAATAYAKDLLCRIPPSRVEKEEKILYEVLDTVSTTDANVTHIKSNLDRKEYLHILDWLTPADYSAQQNEYFKRRQPGTGQWYLDSKEYQAWLEARNQTLFCPGIPGAGKTTLTSIVVEDLATRFQKDEDVGIAYIYCNFRQQDKQEVEDLLASLLKQLASGRPSLPESVKSLYNTHAGGNRPIATRPSIDELSRALKSVTTQYSKVFIVIDALDECQPDERSREIALSTLFSLLNGCNANVCATSRFVPDIEKLFSGTTKLEIRASEEDIQIYIKGHMKKLPSFIERSPQLKAEITAVIAAAVGGMFILAQLYLRLLEDKTTERTVRKTINQFQKQTSESSEVQKLKALGQAYDQTMDRINKQKQGLKELANNVLTWVAFAERPLTTEQLQHALAVEDGEPELGEDNFPEIAVMVSVCAGLVTVDERNIVRLVHYTTQEYFERTKKQWFPRAETYITNTCINYISLTTFAVGDDRKWSEIINRGRIDCLYLYAIKKWGNHARKDSKLNPKVVEFLESRVRPEFKMQVGAEDVLFSHKEFNPPPSVGSGLHLAAYFGLDNTVRALISRGHRPDKVDALNRTPLSWAAANVFGKSTVEMPTQRSVGSGGMSESDLSGRDRFTIQGPTPPVWETINTHKKIAQILLDTGKINPESKDRYGQTPLSLAAGFGSKEVAILLLKTGKVNPDLKDGYGQTPLSYAAESGSKEVVISLLQTGKVDPDSKDNNGQTPLSYAAWSSSREIAILLLETGKVNPDSKNRSGRTPLSYAAESGSREVATLLLQTGKVDPESKDGYGQTQLSLAARYGSKEVAILLLQTGKVDPDSKDRCGQTPLSYAAGYGSKEITTSLLQTGKVDPDSKDNNGQTPLSHAARYGNKEVAILLLNTGKIDPDSKDNNGRTPLSYAAEYGNKEVAILLLETGKVDPDSKDDSGYTPLFHAVRSYKEEIVVLLLETGKVNPDSKNKSGQTPLSYADKSGSKEIAALLHETGKAEPDLRDDDELEAVKLRDKCLQAELV